MTMECINEIASICSICSLIVSLIVAKKVFSISANLNNNQQGGSGNIQRNQSVIGNGNNVGGRDINVR